MMSRTVSSITSSVLLVLAASCGSSSATHSSGQASTSSPSITRAVRLDRENHAEGMPRVVLAGTIDGLEVRLLLASGTNGSLCESLDIVGPPNATTTTQSLSPREQQLLGLLDGRAYSCVPTPEIGSVSSAPVQLALRVRRVGDSRSRSYIAGVVAPGVTELAFLAGTETVAATMGDRGSFVVSASGSPIRRFAFKFDGREGTCPIQWVDSDPIEDCDLPIP